jgi:hypothetical protein
MKKRGQAAGAAILLAIIAGMIILFIVLIPPSEREELLGTGSDSSGDSGGATVSGKALLRESPGRLDFLDKKELEHPLPVITIFTKQESKTIARKNLARVSKKVFSEVIIDFPFVIEDLENVDNVLLAFTIGERSEGSLIVKLNGDEIYNAKAIPGAISPVKIPKNALQENNVITFSASSPGVAFWKINEIVVSDIRVVADVTNLNAQESRNIFLVTETEKSNLERIILSFEPSCRISEVGKLRIQINGREIYNSIPDCDLQLIPIEFSPDNVNQGENEIIFSTEEGTYQLSHVVVKSLLKEVDFPTYYFDLSFEQYRAVTKDDFKVILEMDFVDVTSQKKGVVIFNGHTRNFETDEVSQEIDLSVDIVQGTNAVKIKPSKTLEIRQVRVDLKN